MFGTLFCIGDVLMFDGRFYIGEVLMFGTLLYIGEVLMFGGWFYMGETLMFGQVLCSCLLCRLNFYYQKIDVNQTGITRSFLDKSPTEISSILTRAAVRDFVRIFFLYIAFKAICVSE